MEWTGSVSSDVGEMVRAMRRALDPRRRDRRLDHRPEAFDGPTAVALEHGIPVVAYNADGGKANKRLAYIGQDNYQSGLELGARVVGLVDSGDVYLFIATPRQQNIQPRVDGALDAIRDSGRPIRAHVVASGVDVATERKKIEADLPEFIGEPSRLIVSSNQGHAAGFRKATDNTGPKVRSRLPRHCRQAASLGNARDAVKPD